MMMVASSPNMDSATPMYETNDSTSSTGDGLQDSRSALRQISYKIN